MHVQRNSTSDALILTPRETPAATTANKKKQKFQRLTGKRKEEKQKKEEAEIAKNTGRGVVEAKAISYFDSHLSVLHQLHKIELMPITKDEYKVCLLQTKIQACF